MNTKKYTYNSIGFSILVFLLIRNYLPSFLAVLNTKNSVFISLLFSCITIIFSNILPILSIRRFLDFSPSIFKKINFKKYIPYIFYSQILFLIITLLNQIFINLFYFLTNATAYNQSLLDITDLKTFIIYYISIALFPSIFEELFLRGYILNLLSPYGKFSAIIISSLIFSLMHPNIEQVLSAFLSSLILSWLYLKTNNILVPILSHLLNNSYSFFMIYINQYTHGVFSNVLFVTINIIIFSLGILSFLHLKKKNNLFSLKAYTEKEKDKASFKFFILSPAILISLSFCVYTIWFILINRI